MQRAAFSWNHERVGCGSGTNQPTAFIWLEENIIHVCNEWVLHAVDIVASTWHIFESFVSGETRSFSAVATREPLSLLVWMCHPDLKSLSNWCCIPPTHTSATPRKNVHDPVPIKTPTSSDTSDASSPLHDQSHTEQFYKCNHHQKYIIITYNNIFQEFLFWFSCTGCNVRLQYEARCEKMDLLHPSIDLTLEPKAPRSRELLEHRFMESGDLGLVD